MSKKEKYEEPKPFAADPTLPVDPDAAATLEVTDLQAAAEGRATQRSFRSCVKPSSRVFHADTEGSTERKRVVIDDTVRVKKRRFRGKRN